MAEEHRCYLGYFTAILMDVSKHGNIRSYILVLNQKPIQFFMISTIPLRTFSFTLEKSKWQLTQFMLSEKDLDRLHDLYSVAPRYLQRSNNLVSWTSYHCSKLLSESKDALAEEIYHRIKISSGSCSSPQICYLFSDDNVVDETASGHLLSKSKTVLTERKKNKHSGLIEPSDCIAALTASPSKRKKLSATTNSASNDQTTSLRGARERFSKNVDTILDDIFTRDATIRKLTSNEYIHSLIGVESKRRGQPSKHSLLIPQHPRYNFPSAATLEIKNVSSMSREPVNQFLSLAEKRNNQNKQPTNETSFLHPRKRLFARKSAANNHIVVSPETGGSVDDTTVGHENNQRVTRSSRDSTTKTTNNFYPLSPPATPSETPPSGGDGSCSSDESHDRSELCDSFNKQFSPYVVIEDCKKKKKFDHRRSKVDKGDGTYSSNNETAKTLKSNSGGVSFCWIGI